LNFFPLILHTPLAVLGLAAIVLSTNAQDSATVPATRNDSKVFPIAPALVAQPLAAITAEKLTDAREIARALATGTARVVVMLSPPAALPQTDFASKASLAALHPQIKQAQQNVLDQLPANHIKLRHRFDNIAGFSAEVSVDGLKALQAHPQVLSIEPIFVLKPHLAQGIALIQGITYRSTYNGAGLSIAICDSGIDYNHARLGGGGFPNGKVLGGYDFGDSDADPGPSGEAHGTACAGIAAGDLGTVGDYIGGVAYGAKLYALKITSGTGGSATTADMIAAWDWCVTHKNDNPAFPIMVISTSFGGGQYFATCDSAAPGMTAAANNANAAGISVLASSGNEGYCNALAWPSCISSVISVGAVYDAGFGHYYPCVEGETCAAKIASGGCATHYYVDDLTAPDKVTAYANVASFLTLFAPGNQCYTLDISGSGGYSSGDYDAEFGGTSAACPYAAGAVACLQSAAKLRTGNYLTPAQVRTRLASLGDNVTDTKVAITKPRVNLQRLIDSLGTNPVLNFVSATLIGGNGDQIINPNECNDVRIVVRNDGPNAATNVAAVLSISTPGVTVIQSMSPYPNVPAGAMRTNTVNFKISTSPSFVCGTPIELKIVLSYGGGTNTNMFNQVSGDPNYVISSSNAPIVPGVTDIGNHGDGVLTTITLPFAYNFYGQLYSSAIVSSDGNIQFTSGANVYANVCLPAPGFSDSIFVFWDDLRTDGTDGPAQGIFVSTNGVAPNRIFNIEWRASYYHPGRKGLPVNFEVRLFENLSRFELVYGPLNGSGAGATVGSQSVAGGPFTQFECNTAGLSNGLRLAFQTICVDGGGCGAPIAGFTGSPTNGPAPFTVSFTNLSTGATSYSWNFGDGKTSSAVNPVNTYTNAGSYAVQLTAIGVGGTGTLTRASYIVVTSPPPPVVANFVTSATNGVAPLIVTFTNLSSGAASYAWDFGDGKTSAAMNPINTYANPGTYNVKLTAINGGVSNVLVRTNYIVAIAPAQLIVMPASLDFGLIQTGTSTEAALIVSNAGVAVLNGTAAISGGPFAALSGAAYSLAQSTATNLVVRFVPTSEGVFSNLIVFNSTGGVSTNPLVGRATGQPVIVLLTLNDSDFAFSFDTVPGLDYSVQYKASLDDAVWQTLQSVAGDGTRKVITNSVSVTERRFYQLRVE
jgi:PKD repeat protein